MSDQTGRRKATSGAGECAGVQEMGGGRLQTRGQLADGVVERETALAVPSYGGLALVGDANGCVPQSRSGIGGARIGMGAARAASAPLMSVGLKVPCS